MIEPYQVHGYIWGNSRVAIAASYAPHHLYGVHVTLSDSLFETHVIYPRSSVMVS